MGNIYVYCVLLSFHDMGVSMQRDQILVKTCFVKDDWSV